MSAQSFTSSLQWYLIYTNPKQEHRAESNLRAWGIETINPKLRAVRANPYKVTTDFITKPLFPRYIFARFIFKELFHKVRFARGVQQLVFFGEAPALVGEDIIEIMRSRLDQNGYVRVSEALEPGDKVTVKDGPLKDFTGVFERKMKDSARVMILLNTVGYQAHYEIDIGLLERVG